MRTIGLLILMGLLALGARGEAKPRDNAKFPRVPKTVQIATNAEENSYQLIALYTAVDTINEITLEPILAVKMHGVAAKHLFNPFVPAVIYETYHVFSNILDIFSGSVLGMAGGAINPLEPYDLVGNKAFIRKNIEPIEPDVDSLYEVTLHEMFHFVGIPHVGDADDIMYWQYNKPNKKIGIYTILEMYIRYELKPQYNKQVEEWVKEQEKKKKEKEEKKEVPPASKVPAWDDTVIMHTCSGGKHRVKI